MEDEPEKLLRIFPHPGGRVPLQGLYLNEPFSPPGHRSKRFVYTNFLTSLDGRVSLPDPQGSKLIVPPALANNRDWRLFQELAACADALITSGRYVRNLPRGVSARSFPISAKPEYADLLSWRHARGLAPQPAVVIVTASLDLPDLEPLTRSGRSVYVATGCESDTRKVTRIESQGARVLYTGDGTHVTGGALINALTREAHWNIAMIGGGEVLRTLLVDDALDRLYLTLACRMLGGLSFDTLLTGDVLEPAAGFTLKALHFDACGPTTSDVEQLFAILDRSARHSATNCA